MALFTVGLLLGPAPKLEAEGLGPFYLPPLGPSETFRAVPAFVVPASQTASEFTWYARVVNVWALNVASARPLSDMDNAYTVPFRYGAFLLDYEGYQVGLRSSYALSPRMRLEVDVPLYYVGSGHTDALIEGFHRTFGISQHRRDEWPRNQTHFLFVLPTGERLINSRQDMGGVFLGNVGLGATLELSQGNPGLGMRFLVHIPTTDAPDVFDENGSNATWQTVAHWRWWRIDGYHGIGATWYGSDGNRFLNLRRLRFSCMNTLEYALGRDLSLLVHTVAASPAADYPELDDWIVEVSCGFRQRWRRWELELALIENLFFFDNSPDAGIHLSITTALP